MKFAFLLTILPLSLMAQVDQHGNVLPLRSSKADLVRKAFIDQPPPEEKKEEKPFFEDDIQEAGANFGVKFEGENNGQVPTQGRNSSVQTGGGGPSVTSERHRRNINIDLKGKGFNLKVPIK